MSRKYKMTDAAADRIVRALFLKDEGGPTSYVSYREVLKALKDEGFSPPGRYVGGLLLNIQEKPSLVAAIARACADQAYTATQACRDLVHAQESVRLVVEED